MNNNEEKTNISIPKENNVEEIKNELNEETNDNSQSSSSNKKGNIVLLIIVLIFLVVSVIFTIIILPALTTNIEKPILYLYPENDINVNIKFKKPDLLITSYPKYVDSWNYQVQSDGTIIDNDKKYYALYWDESTNHKVDFEEGFYVEENDAIDFLEKTLTQIGLNYKEKNEFIMYWLPILEKNEKNLVYFEFTEEREKHNKLIISPKPDSLLRFAIHIKKVNKKINIAPQEITTFERTGFVAVEWGGVIY